MNLNDTAYHLTAEVQQSFMQHDFDSAEYAIRKAIEAATLKGLKQGLQAFAWWKDGVEYVGTCGTTLKDALAAADVGEI